MTKPTACTCDSLDLFRQGCTCGYLKSHSNQDLPLNYKGEPQPFKVGSLITGIDRSYVRSIYLVHHYFWKKAELRLVSFDGYLPDPQLKNSYPTKITDLEASFRLATPEEVTQSANGSKGKRIDTMKPFLCLVGFIFTLAQPAHAGFDSRHLFGSLTSDDCDPTNYLPFKLSQKVIQAVYDKQCQVNFQSNADQESTQQLINAFARIGVPIKFMGFGGAYQADLTALIPRCKSPKSPH